ncbi:hypothetical protein PV326_000401 [Microctonus aethiopoides]|nr:hypothetical protein PV326_000401 [Microctonus aethiopoides]
MTQASDETRQNGAYESIGYKRKDNNNITVHIGKGLFIPETNFNIMLNSSSPSVFVRNASRVVFGEDVLLCSTVTGKHSNRSKKKGAIPAPTPLNPSGLDLIHGQHDYSYTVTLAMFLIYDPYACFLKYFLNMEKFNHLTEMQKLYHLNSVSNYVGALISELKKEKRVAGKNAKKNSAIEENCNAEEENYIDEEDRDNVSEKDEDNIDEDHQSIVVDEEHANDFGEKDEENSDDKYYSSDTETVLNEVELDFNVKKLHSM